MLHDDLKEETIYSVFNTYLINFKDISSANFNVMIGFVIEIRGIPNKIFTTESFDNQKLIYLLLFACVDINFSV